MLSEKDKQQLKDKGITPEQLVQQLERFEQGFPFLQIVSAATTQRGIMNPTSGDVEHYEQAWNQYTQGEQVITKFVPASGAASRMFKDLFSFLDAPYDVPTTPFEKEFFQGLSQLAFYDTLERVSIDKYKLSIDSLIQSNRYKDVIHCLLDSSGLSYGSLPKGLLEFHKYGDTTRRPVEEHLVEGALYAANASKQVNLHFTVSPEHEEMFRQLLHKKVPFYEQKYNVVYTVSISTQKLSTDTLAVDINNQIFRDGDTILFRPGGHGALIENLNDIDSDIIFIKNVDNTIPDRLKETETKYKKVLAGILIQKQAKAFQYLSLLDSGSYTHDQLLEILYFLQNELNIKNPETKYLEDAELVLYLKQKLNRPMRACGMVKNEGEPGGGPFFVVNADNTISLQILEESQIDTTKEENELIVKNSTHFNPVDIVCAVKDYEGQKFDLLKCVDPNTGFISSKSKDGRALKALELPGLWNGAMSGWSTIFVEVPIQTFNPVKTVNDLFRSNHLG